MDLLPPPLLLLLSSVVHPSGLPFRGRPEEPHPPLSSLHFCQCKKKKEGGMLTRGKGEKSGREGLSATFGRRKEDGWWRLRTSNCVPLPGSLCILFSKGGEREKERKRERK